MQTTFAIFIDLKIEQHGKQTAEIGYKPATTGSDSLRKWVATQLTRKRKRRRFRSEFAAV